MSKLCLRTPYNLFLVFCSFALFDDFGKQGTNNIAKK